MIEPKANPPEAATPSNSNNVTKAITSLKDAAEPKIKQVLLKELGPTLPLGIPDANGVLHRNIEVRRWRGAEEREVSQIRTDSKERGDFISRLLGFMFTQVGEHNFDKMKEPERQVVISQMHMGDVLYMYVWLRMKCLGSSVKMNLTCPRSRCSFEFPFDADLNSIEVRTAATLEDVKWSYDLLDPFDLRGSKATGFDLGPIKWGSMEESIRKALETGDTDAGMPKMDMIKQCIQGVKGRDPMVLIDSELDEISKLDIETLVSRLDEHEIGPDMSVDVEKCKRCKKPFRTSLDWSYGNFFGVSSPS